VSAVPTQADILLVDDGELDALADLLEAQGLPYSHLRGGLIPAEVSPPRDLLIVTPRRAERVRRGSPPDAAPGSPLRIIASAEDSPAMRRNLRRSGIHLLVRLPANAETWHLLIDRALYRGHERRDDPRVAVLSPVTVRHDAGTSESETPPTVLIDLSNRGCRLRTREPLAVGDRVAFTIPTTGEGWGDDGEALTLSGRIRRGIEDRDSATRTVALTFDDDLPAATRARLTSLINRWASGPSSLAAAGALRAPAIPPCQLPSLPDLILDDETDPPIRSGSEVEVSLAPTAAPSQGESDSAQRRRGERARFASPISAEGDTGRLVLIGRDLSVGGMRIERLHEHRVADRFRIALHGPGPSERFVVEAEIDRDDGEEGFALVFRDADPRIQRQIEKLVACLPGVESLEDTELGGVGAILSEILQD